MLVLHAEKGLVRAGTPDLKLFHQESKIIDVTFAVTVAIICTIAVTISVTIAIIVVTIAIIAVINITFVTFFPAAVLGCCVFF